MVIWQSRISFLGLPSIILATPTQRRSHVSQLLHIVASPRTESYSTRVAKAFLDSYRQERPDDEIETLDLYQADIPPFHAPQAKAKYAVIAGRRPRRG